MKPCWASVTAKFELQNVLPSEGTALVNMNTRRSSALAAIASDVRSVRNDSATMPSRSVTMSSLPACLRALRGTAVSTGTPASRSAWSIVLIDWSMKCRLNAMPSREAQGHQRGNHVHLHRADLDGSRARACSCTFTGESVMFSWSGRSAPMRVFTDS